MHIRELSPLGKDLRSELATGVAVDVFNQSFAGIGHSEFLATSTVFVANTYNADLRTDILGESPSVPFQTVDAMPAKFRVAADVHNVREVSQLGSADLSYWQDR